MPAPQKVSLASVYSETKKVIESGNLASVRALLSQIDSIEQQGTLEKGAFDIYKFLSLSEHGSNATTKSPVYLMIVLEKIEFLRTFIEWDKAREKPSTSIDLPGHEDFGCTALMLAAQKGCLDCLTLLLENGANPNIKHPLWGNTALHYAGGGDYLACFNKLLKNGADPNIDNSDGETACLRSNLFRPKSTQAQGEVTQGNVMSSVVSSFSLFSLVAAVSVASYAVYRELSNNPS